MHLPDNVHERFWSKVDKTGECWEWRSNTHRQGYGFFKLNGRNMLAHRVAYMLTYNEELPSAVKLLHSCDNPKCVNPSHLSKGTQFDNIMDMVRKGRHVGSAKLTFDEVTAIRADSRPQIVIEKEYGLAKGTVSKIKSGLIYIHVAGESPITFEGLQLEVRRLTERHITDNNLGRELNCEDCNSTHLVHPHHADYSKPFDFKWLCRKCRKRWIRRHRFVLYTFASTETEETIISVMKKFLYYFNMGDRGNLKVYVGVDQSQTGTQDALA